jgi:hypothetical protein
MSAWLMSMWSDIPVETLYDGVRRRPYTAEECRIGEQGLRDVEEMILCQENVSNVDKERELNESHSSGADDH